MTDDLTLKGKTGNDQLDLSHYTEYCEETMQMVYSTCHRSCEGCTTVCPGPHYPAAIILEPEAVT